MLKRTPGTSTNLQPVIRYRPYLALKSHLLTHADSQSNNQNAGPQNVQSASTIHLDYGRSLRPMVMLYDTRYALREIFELVAQAELQFLQLCDAKLRDFENINFIGDPDRSADLKNMKQVLYRHLLQNQEAEGSLEVLSTHTGWPKANDLHLKARADRSMDELKEDFKKLTKMTEQLHTQCTATIGLLMNEIVIVESREARLQAARLKKLTFLAFIFVPLSFTTSFFGMTIRELGADAGSLSIWAWFSLSLPLLLVTLGFYKYDMNQVRLYLRRALQLPWQFLCDRVVRGRTSFS